MASLRISAAVFFPLAASALAASTLVCACGSMSAGLNGFSNGSPGGGSSGGGVDSGNGPGLGDAGLPDAGTIAEDAGEAGVAPQTSVLFVHGSPRTSLSDVRLCWSTGGGFGAAPPFPSGAPMPASNYAGLAVGGAVTLSPASDLLGASLTIDAIDANTLAQFDAADRAVDAGPMEFSCASRVGGVPPAAVTPLPVRGTLAQGATNVLAVRGCTASDPNGSTASCGADWVAGKGNLHVDVIPVYAAAPVPTGQLAVQAVQLSPALAELAGDPGAAVSFGEAAGGGDAGDVPVATLTAEGQLLPAPAAALDAGTAMQVYGQLGFAVDVAAVDGGAGHLWMSLAHSLLLVDPSQDPALYYTRPTTYLAAVVGDPNAPRPFEPSGGGSYDGTGLHVLVLALPLAD